MIGDRTTGPNYSNRTRNKLRRKRRHERQLEIRKYNEDERYNSKMNNYEYDTWLSQVSAAKNACDIYGEQIKNKEHMLKDIVNKTAIRTSDSSLISRDTTHSYELCVEYDIIDKGDLEPENCLLM